MLTSARGVRGGGVVQCWTLVFSLWSLTQMCQALTAVYLPSSCGQNVVVLLSLQVESATGLTYTNNVNCDVTLTTTAPYVLLANFRRFELERQISGTCNDYVNLHDGSDVSSVTLNTAPLCGSSVSNASFVSRGQAMTIHFVTDASAVFQGFNLVVAAVTRAPCSTTHHTCNNSYCVDSSLVCDDYNQCADNSDEDNCASLLASSTTNWVPLIVGLTLGTLALVLVIAFIAYRYHRRNKWRRFADDHVDTDDLPDPDPSYPVTHKYFRGMRGRPDLPAYSAIDPASKAAFHPASDPASPDSDHKVAVQS